MSIEDFVTKNYMLFFNHLKISTEFLKTKPGMWELSDYYKTAMKIIYHLKDVNDNAERGVALIEEYNSIITKKENQKQYFFQVEHDHRRKFPECKKDVFMAK